MGIKIQIIHKKINIVEGVYSLHPLYDKIYTLKIFLEVDENEQKCRVEVEMFGRPTPIDVDFSQIEVMI